MIDLSFTIVSARTEPHAAAPTLVLRLRISAANQAAVHTGLVRCVIQIEPRRRRYSSDEGERLLDLFGEPARWHDTMRPLFFTQVAIVVPSFEGVGELDVPVAAPSDVAAAAAKYFHGLDTGDVALLCQFSGTIFVATANGYQVTQVPWDKEATFRLPVSLWREAMDQHFPDSAWIRLPRDTFDALSRFRMRRALLTWEAAIDALCEESDARTPV
jgi:hypothetical protein